MKRALLGTLRVILPLAVLTVAVVAAAVLVRTRPPVATQPPTIEPPGVRVHQVTLDEVPLTVASQGTVRPRTESQLVSEIAGRVISVSPSFAEGGFFEANDVLVRIDTFDYEQAIVAARSQLAQARLMLAQEEAEADVAAREWAELGRGDPRELTLRKPQLEDARASVAAAEASLERAERDLERAHIVAPYAGRVRRKDVDVGQFVTVGASVATIYAVDTAEVRLPLPDEELAFLDLPLSYRGGTNQATPAVTLRATFAGETHEWEGRIVRTESEIDPVSRMVHVVAEVDDPYAAGPNPNRPPLAVGMYVEAEIEGRMARDVAVVPRAALRGAGQVVVVGPDDRISFRDVDILRTTTATMLVREGLTPGELVAVSPLDAATEGMRVQLANVDRRTLAQPGAAPAEPAAAPPPAAMPAPPGPRPPAVPAETVAAGSAPEAPNVRPEQDAPVGLPPPAAADEPQVRVAQAAGPAQQPTWLDALVDTRAGNRTAARTAGRPAVGPRDGFRPPARPASAPLRASVTERPPEVLTARPPARRPQPASTPARPPMPAAAEAAAARAPAARLAPAPAAAAPALAAPASRDEAPHTFAVTRFATLGTGPAGAGIGDALARAVASGVTGPGLQVVGSAGDARFTIDGGVQQVGPAVRVTARITDTAGSDAVRSIKVDGSADDLPALRLDVVSAIGQRLAELASPSGAPSGTDPAVGPRLAETAPAAPAEEAMAAAAQLARDLLERRAAAWSPPEPTMAPALARDAGNGSGSTPSEAVAGGENEPVAAMPSASPVAVLTFDELGTSANDVRGVSLGRVITDTVTARLADLPEVTIVTLGDDAVWTVGGGIQRVGDVVRVTARVVEIASGAVVTSVKVDGSVTELADLQNRVAAA
ncbi:MAG: efflux RND transporter periplasmic adaptor subunit, partial [Acidobacteria bacterium]|nr:efflux RND transporter periplasmic adaptor subunit [Acidobacteriota bacterium]